MCSVGVPRKCPEGGEILMSKLEATQVCDMLHILFRFLLAGWRLTEVETPYADARTTKVQHPSSFSDIFFGLFKFFPLTVPSHEFFHGGIFLRKMIQGEQPHIGVTGSRSNRGITD